MHTCLQSTVHGCSGPYLQALGIRPAWRPSSRMNFIRLGSVTADRENGLTGEQLAVGTDSRFVSVGPRRVFSVLAGGCHVGCSRGFVGAVCCAYGRSNTTIVMYCTFSGFLIDAHKSLSHVPRYLGHRLRLNFF